MANIFEPVVEAYREGMKDLQDTFQVERDPAIRIYNKLKSPDFQALEKKYGQGQVADYIRSMESRRLRR